MMIVIEGTPGSGKTTLRDRVLALAVDRALPTIHLGQFCWLSVSATRTLVALRTDRDRAPEHTALTAAVEDLTLHNRHNLVPGLQDHHVIGDRLILSTACLLADHYPRPVEQYVAILADATSVRADLTVLADTAPHLCAARVATRPTPPRPSDRIDAVHRQFQLYHRAATAWQRTTGQQVLSVTLHEPTDTEHTARLLLAHLESGPPA